MEPLEPLTEIQQEELKAVVDRVASYIDNDPQMLLNSLRRSASTHLPTCEGEGGGANSDLESKEGVSGGRTHGVRPYRNIEMLEEPLQNGEPFTSPPLPPKPQPPPIPPRDSSSPRKEVSTNRCA